MDYVAILGRQPEIGFVELECVLGKAAVQPFGRQAALVGQRLDIDRLGGVVKLARVLSTGSDISLQDLPIDVASLPLRDGKTPFAVSLYGSHYAVRDSQVAGLALKKRLKARGSVRLVQPVSGTAVTAAGLKYNKVLDKGFELLVITAGSRSIIACTESVQDVDAYAARDYARPARSASVGMLPPKLAQFLVNTVPAGVSVADPFCGTGVVLQEALLAGRTCWGADVAQTMVGMSQANLEWLGQQYGALPGFAVLQADARSVKLPPGYAVVSEGYLGPALVVPPTQKQLQEIEQSVLALYRQTLLNWAGQLESGAVVALCAPSWRFQGSWHHLKIIDELPKMGYSLREFKHATTPLLYARPDQVVGRRLLLMRKS
jgi:tRNA G10  N-methylase Trm11